MVPLCVPLPPAPGRGQAPSLHLLVEIAASTAALGSVAPPYPGSAVPDGVAGRGQAPSLHSAHPQQVEPGYAKLLCVGDRTAVLPAVGERALPVIGIGTRLALAPGLPLLSSQVSTAKSVSLLS